MMEIAMLPIDKNGFEITPGDTVKIFHYIGPRNKKNFMYKFIQGVDGRRLIISHLSLTGGTFTVPMDGKVLPDYEIVQGYENCRLCFTDRPRKKV